MDKFCSYCGAPLTEEAKFCGKCGMAVGGPWQGKSFDSNVDYGVFPNREYYDRNPADDLTIKEKYFSHRGRLNRKRYFFRGLIADIVFFVIMLFMDAISPILSIPFWVASIVCSVMLNIRRCHDLDKSGWFSLLLLVPIVGIIVAIYLLLAKGTEGLNHYGPDPLFTAPLLKR